MKLAVVKYGRIAQKFLSGLPEENRVISICEPDIGRMVQAQLEYPDTDYSFEYSDTINNKRVDTVLISIPEKANEIALVALAYGKRIVSLVSLDKRIHQVAQMRDLAVSEIL